MRRAADITSKAFADVAPLIRPGVRESDLERAVLGSFKKNGATGMAFRPVIGAGPNAVLPHHVTDGSVLESGFVVIDIGCSFEHYASDMTRTFTVRAEPTNAERRLLEIVSRAKSEAVSTLRAGSRLSDADRAARKVIREAGFGPYFVHFIGHGVGLDVHDPSPDLLEAGMVVTVEPGIYIPKGSPVDPAFWNLGVRIEDTYLVTRTGSEALTRFPQTPSIHTGTPAPVVQDVPQQPPTD
jgi:Xaa-Pro aminopeptidase